MNDAFFFIKPVAPEGVWPYIIDWNRVYTGSQLFVRSADRRAYCIAAIKADRRSPASNESGSSGDQYVQLKLSRQWKSYNALKELAFRFFLTEKTGSKRTHSFGN